MSIGGVLLVAGAALGGYLIYDYWENQKAAGCPEGQKLTDLVARVADGSIDAVTAENMARGFDAAGCDAAASAVRVASHMRAVVPAKEHPASSFSESLGSSFGSSAPKPSAGYYELTYDDIASGVDSFASKAGYVGPRAMADNQPASVGMSILDNSYDGVSGPSVFTEKDLLGRTKSYRIMPWTAGTKVWVLKDPTAVSTSGYRRVPTEWSEEAA